jgi:hypothetical protein
MPGDRGRVGDDGGRLRLRLGRRFHAGDDRHAERGAKARSGIGAAPDLILRRTTLLVACALLGPAGPAAAQAGARGPEVIASIAALRTDADLAARHEVAWIPVVEGRIGWRVTSMVALAAGAWVGRVDAAADTLDTGPLESRSLLGAGLVLDLAPFADRGGATQPVLRFGLESIQVDDRLDRGPAFVFGAGVERRLGSSWSVALRVENRFLTIERQPVDGVATSRDVALWSGSLALAWGPRS